MSEMMGLDIEVPQRPGSIQRLKEQALWLRRLRAEQSTVKIDEINEVAEAVA